ncbi:MAG: TonB-dependent receptor [Spongiibacteraceae bacterium]|nr:TonB-dependent receptor [Spongiibacteraceae bacterium]MBN4055299.1 TonB-dependent receptor [bacterium AH-315-K03]
MKYSNQISIFSFCLKTLLVLVLMHCHALFAAGVPGVAIEEVQVVGSLANQELVGDAQSASVGTVTLEQLQYRPLSRPAEVLEAIPGMVVTQHSGEGKANQYFLRGFNLDHGTDFATYVEGMPVNMVSHGHGQGYSDANFLIPELVDHITYRKGPYYAEAGDFSSAGSARIYYVDESVTKIKVTGGRWGYQRLLTTGMVQAGENRRFLVALEGVRYDGPWDTKQALEKNNAFIKFSAGDSGQGFDISVMAYENQWHSTDQIPQRLVQSGELGRYGDLDPLTGGDTHRFSLSSSVWGNVFGGRYQASVYGVDYELRLTSNASYFLDSPDSDRFTQYDERNTLGGSFSWRNEFSETQLVELGSTLRYDDISNVGFERVDGMSRDFSRLEELGAALYGSVTSDWTEHFSSVVGLRYDVIDFDVAGYNDVTNPDSSVDGKETKGLLSPKLSLRFGPWAETEFFMNVGQGFHSNDARGVVKPNSDVDALAKSQGAELGLRSALIPSVQFSAALFVLDLDSELVFVGDDGTTEVRDKTRRTGLEFGVYYQPASWLIVDMDAAFSHARFRDQQYEDENKTIVLGRHVPDAMSRVFSMGASMDFDNGVFAGISARYFGPRDLDEAGDVRSDSTFVVNANVGYQWRGGLRVSLEVLNMFDSDDDDITYYYESLSLEERGRGESAQLDKHSHPVEPFNARVSVEYRFE